MAKNKKSKKFKAILKIISFLVLIGLIIGIFIYVSPSYHTQVVFNGVEELTLPLSGVVILDEELLSSDKKGFAVMNYSDATRVLAKTHVASLYSSGIDEAKVSKLRELNEKINTLEVSLKNQNKDEALGDSSTSVLLKRMKRVSYYSSKGDFSSLQKETTDLSNLIYGSNTEAQASKLESLKNEKMNIEGSIDANATEFFSKTAGVLYSKTDGYETSFSVEAANSITPSALETIMASKPVDYSKAGSQYIFGKIVNNYEVTVLAVCNEADVADIMPDEDTKKILTIKSPDITNGSVSCTVVSVSPPEDGKVVLSLLVSRNIESFIKERKIQFELVKKSYKGFRVPCEAVREGENKDAVMESYVFAVKDGVVVKKPVEILYKTDKYAIVKDDVQNPKNLLLYDLVITKSRNISEGTLVTVNK